MTERHGQPETIDLAALRAKLAHARGKQYWRSLDELAQTPAFQQFIDREFPAGPEWHDPISRRSFLRIMAASIALAGLQGCRDATSEPIVPYVRQPEYMVPGVPLYFATAHTLGGYARGTLVQSHDGRPTKVEGNALHPAAPPPANANTDTHYPNAPADIFAQAALLTLYDPDRSQSVRLKGRIDSWTRFQDALRAAMKRAASRDGAGVRILTETVTSPTLASQLASLLERYPQARWHQYEPVVRDHARAAAMTAFGRAVDTRYRFDQAAIVLALDSDFLMPTQMPGAAARYAHDFMTRRRVLDSTQSMNRLYVLEPTPSNTGAVADHRLALAPDEIEQFAQTLAARVAGDGPTNGVAPPSRVEQAWFDAVVEDLLAHRGASLIIAGEHTSPRLQTLAHAMNAALGNVGNTVVYTEPVEALSIDHMQSLRELVVDMRAGRVQTLVILGGNPVYSAPADMAFQEALENVPLTAHLSLYNNETSFHSQWHVPLAHELEAWGDARAFDGTATIQQPLIAPLYEGRTPYDVMATLLDQSLPTYEIVRSHWRNWYGNDENFEAFWRRSVHDGMIDGTQAQPIDVALQVDLGTMLASPPARGPGELYFIMRPDPSIYDGRFANNGWLQELPKPITTITWDNAAYISPALAQSLGVENEQFIELTFGGRTLRVAAWIVPGQCDDCVTLTLGYGRSRAGNVGSDLGFNANALRTSTSPWAAPGLRVQPLEDRYALSRTQHHHTLDGRPILRELTFARFLQGATGAEDHAAHHPHSLSLYEPFDFVGKQWGMAIDLTACIGCNACVIACQSENNIPIVGKDQVAAGREMHWIRVDTYFKGALDAPDATFQPVTCMHCEKAPCEPVCPVGATIHSDDGLNDMVYNRCIGTRYCSNNCPYKVRRFNFLQYNDPTVESLQLMRNPNVTVRSRGVMEKCTYCVQRIRRVGIDAKRDGGDPGGDAVVTACQAACPTQAIVFGDINDPNSAVARYRKQQHQYAMLEELNTQPRTTYLARVRNPHPRLDVKHAIQGEA